MSEMPDKGWFARQMKRTTEDVKQLPAWLRRPDVAKPEPSVPLSAIRALVQQWRKHVELCEQKIETYRYWERNKELAAIWNEQRYSFTVCADQLAALRPAPPEDQP